MKSLKKMIVVTSDTHASSILELPQALIEAMSVADLIVHAGDFDRWSLYEDLMDFDLIAVAGNSDDDLIRNSLPEVTTFEWRRRRFAVKHEPIFFDCSDLIYKAKELEARVMIFGHTHRPLLGKVAGIWLLNPGSPTRPRAKYATFIEIEDEIILRGVNGEVIERADFER